MLKTLLNNNYKLMYVIVAFLAVNFFFSPTLSMFLMGVHKLVNPMIGFHLWTSPLYPVGIVSVLITSSVCALIALWWLKGVYRYVACLGLIGVGGLLVGVSLGCFIFSKVIHLKTIVKPWQILTIWIDAPTSVASILFACLGVGAILVILFALFSIKEKETVLGQSAFANPWQAYKAGFFSKEGLILGKAWGQVLRSKGYEHILVFAPTGSGKTRSIAIPNLLTYQGSCVVNDVKLTLHNKTKNHREIALGQKCFLWSLQNAKVEKTHRFNPLFYVEENSPEFIANAQHVSHILIPDDNKESPIWAKQGRAVLTALIIYLKQTEKEAATLGVLNKTLKQADFDSWLEAITHYEGYHPVFYQNAYAYLNQPEKTRGSTLATVTAAFEIFGDPLIEAATSGNDFDFRKLHQEKMTIYVGFNYKDLHRLSPLLTLFWEQLLSTMLIKIPDKDEPYDVLCLLDEFSALGKMPILKDSLKLLREYKVRCVILMQYLAQTMEKYTQAEAEAFLNIKTKVTFPLDSLKDAEYVSKLLGQKTGRIKNRSTHSQERGASQSFNYNLQSVPLMRSEEIQQMKEGEALIIRTGSLPIKSKQCR